MSAEPRAGAAITPPVEDYLKAIYSLSREDLAVQAFAQALQKQPDLELDSVRTSPRVLKALETAKKAHKSAPGKSARGN